MKKARSLFALALFFTATLTLLPKPAAAQDADPPGRVARLNYIQGSVSLSSLGRQHWVDADPNRPLTTGDNLWADNNSRGELHIGSTAIRLSSQTGISFLNLDDEGIQLQLAQGTIEVHLRNLASGDIFEIDTPNLSFTPDRAGDYRIMTDPNGGSTMITVRQGSGEVTGGGGSSWPLRAGQQYTFNGTDRISYDAMGAPATMILTTGVIREISAKIILLRRSTFHATWMVITISTSTAIGIPIPTTEVCGTREASRWIGRLTRSATGFMSRRGAGRGWTKSRGDLRHFTTAAGRT